MEGFWRGMRRAGKLALGGVAALGWMALAGGAQAEWQAPEEERQVPNPVERTAESVEIGHKLYRENCETCHGAGGRGDGPGARVLEARLPDFTDKAWADTKTDGEWFYKISVGKDPMVGYEDFLEEDEIWHTVNFVRSLSAGLGGTAASTTVVANTVLAQAEEASVSDAEAAEEAAGSDAAAAEAVATDSAVEAEAHGEEVHGAAVAEAHEGGDPHGDAAHGDEAGHEASHGEAAHGEAHGEAHGAGAADFDPRGIANYESTHAKAPLNWALIVSVLIGGVFVAFQKMVPPPPGSEAPAGGGHGHDDGHGHGHH